MFKRLFSVALIFGAAALPPPALAQTVTCLPRVALVDSLQIKHGEQLTGGGLQSPAHVVEIWSSDKTGSFTVFISRADGIACIVATGQYWHNAVKEIEPKGVIR